MELFEKYIAETIGIIEKCGYTGAVETQPWGRSEKNAFLMDRDTACELGGYPKESVNLIMNTEGELPIAPGVYIVGDESVIDSEEHVSFGKIVLLANEPHTEDELYPFSQELVMCDTKLWLDGIMQRTSPKYYNTNLKVGKKARQTGFSLSRFGRTVQEAFCEVKGVRGAAVFIMIGDHGEAYKQLLDIAEKAREITVALNHIFDGINMDCGHCDMNAICDEVQELRKMHKKKK